MQVRWMEWLYHSTCSGCRFGVLQSKYRKSRLDTAKHTSSALRKTIRRQTIYASAQPILMLSLTLLFVLQNYPSTSISYFLHPMTLSLNFGRSSRGTLELGSKFVPYSTITWYDRNVSLYDPVSTVRSRRVVNRIFNTKHSWIVTYTIQTPTSGMSTSLECADSTKDSHKIKYKIWHRSKDLLYFSPTSTYTESRAWYWLI